MFIQTKRLMVVLAMFAFVISGCGPKAAPQTSVMDTPEYHYAQGLKYLDKDQLDDAMREFQRAVDLDPKLSLGYIGRGLTLGKKGDFKTAIADMEKAKGYESKGIEARIGMIRLLTMQQAKGWIKDAESEFSTAKDREPNNPKLYYYMGVAYKIFLDFDKATPMFRTVLDLKGDFTAEANAEWEIVQKIQRAAPGTEIGKKIALIDKIGRADIAALFDQELNLEKLYTKRGPKTYDTSFKAPTEASTRFSPDKMVKMEPATDIENHWLKPSINAILKIQVRGLEAGPNHKFDPDKIITKGEFAVMLEDILIKVTGDEKLATKYLGTPSTLPDVRGDHYFFNAAMLVTTRGFLQADKVTGEFRQGDSVSGADALLSIRAFKDALKY